MIILSYGLPGMGKTTWMHDYVKNAQQSGYRFCIVDHADEWGPEGAHWRGKPPPLNVVEEDDRNPDLEEPGLYVFQGWEGLDVANVVTNWGNAVYVDDELDLVARRQQVLGVSWDESPLRKIVHQGRHLRNKDGDITECHLIGACRRPQSLHTDVSEQASHVVIFRIQGSRTLERLRADSHIEDDDWDTIRNLPKFHYREWPTGKWLSVPPLGGGAPKGGEKGKKRRDEEDEAPEIEAHPR